MSEQKRGTLTSLGTNKKEKKSKEPSKTVRFTLSLPESNEKSCPEFNYSVLLGSAEKKRKAKLKIDGQVNGVDPLGIDDDEDVRNLAKHFEQKYGGVGKKKHGRYEDYVDLGAGYDETDPFIDNTDAYDEVVPEEMTTAHGGFYINCGALEFKEVSDHSNVESPDPKTKKHLKREAEDDDEADGKKIHNNVPKKPKVQMGEQNEEVIRKRKLVSHDRDIVKKRKKRAIDLAKKKSATVKELLREKRETEAEGVIGVHVLPEQNKLLPTTTSVPAKPSNPTSYADAIESVVSAAREDETSKDSASSISKSGSLITSDSEESQDAEEKEKAVPSNEEVKLPENLQDDLKDLITALKKRASESSAEGKCKFFSAEVNEMLLWVEVKCRALTCSGRHAVYSHLAAYLPCTKDTLMKRAKKLIIKAEEDKLLEPMKKLKAVIDRVMPSVLENHSKECQKTAEEKSVEELPSTESEGETGEAENKSVTQKAKVPRRRFPWTNEVRSLLCEVVRIKLQCLELIKPRKETANLTLRNFLETEVKPLWPLGWMKVSTLLKESREVHASAMVKSKKSAAIRKTHSVVANANTGVANLGNITLQPVTAISQASTINNSARIKPSASVSITMTPVPAYPPSQNSTPKTKFAVSPETATSVITHSTTANVTVRTKSATPVSQTHAVITSVPVTSAPVNSNVQNSTVSLNTNKNLGSHPSPSFPVRKKTNEVTIAKVPMERNNQNFVAEKHPTKQISGKCSPAFQSEQQLSPNSFNPKQKTTIDLTTSPVRQLVPSISNKTKPNVPEGTTITPRVNTNCNNSQKTSTKSPLPQMNIPGCISITPTMPSQAQDTLPSVSSASITPTSTKPLSLKQRILHDSALDQANAAAKAAPPPVSVTRMSDDDGIEVIEIVKETRKVDPSKSLVKQAVKNEIPMQSKVESRKKKKEVIKDAAPQNAYKVEKQKTEVQAPLMQQEKDVERQLKEEEETAAAADYLSQINESLENYPTDDLELAQQSSPLSSPKLVLSPLSKHEESPYDPKLVMDLDEKGKGNNSKKKADQVPPQDDDEESVQIEVARVMKELRDLQGHFSSEKTRDIVDVVDMEYPCVKTASSARSSPASGNNNSVSVTVTSTQRMQHTKVSKQYLDTTVTPVSSRRLSSGSSEITKMSYGFQDEFQKHLFQERANSVEDDVASFKAVRSKPALTFTQAAVHGAIRQSQNSPEGHSPMKFFP